jgi:hypothetical protein
MSANDSSRSCAECGLRDRTRGYSRCVACLRAYNRAQERRHDAEHRLPPLDHDAPTPAAESRGHACRPCATYDVEKLRRLGICTHRRPTADQLDALDALDIAWRWAS